MKKVAVLMSGGVDSSVAAYILSKNFDIVGITLKLWDCGQKDIDSSKQLCCSSKDIYDAKAVCVDLGIKHYVIDFSDQFKKYIIDKFCDKYLNGFTPNPCVWCNEIIKFGVLFEKLKMELGVDYIASGHYARIVRSNDMFYIAKAKDESKDQSYFLSRVNPKILPYIIFPLGDLLKSEVRKIAKEINLKVAEKKESFDLCFVLDNYRSIIRTKNCTLQRGKILDYKTKKFLGYHNGYFNYTIGQRKGLMLRGVGMRYYVVDIDSKNNIVYVGSEDILYKNSLVAENCVFYENIEELKNKNLYGKIRYKSNLAKCFLEKIEDDKVVVVFEEPQRAITKGQYLVIYDIYGRVLLNGEIVNF
ncbi:MAG: tRNA 2-thiouridine(34) synthase MnmA [Endomicrobia bacterium]|nr:tRNA 2-thiouridine(34) synthase MnmA [Endomicrobiia bacterium]